MRILLTTTRGAGHFGPCVPFARAFRRAGHDLLVTVPQSARAMVEREGFAAHAVEDGDPDARATAFATLRGLSADQANARVAAEIFCRIDARAAMPGIQAAIESWQPDVVVSDICSFAGPLAAEAAGVPAIQIGITLGLKQDWIAGEFLEALDELRAENGLPADPDGRRFGEIPLFTLAPTFFDDDATAARHGRVHQFRETTADAGALPDVLRPGVDDERPLVYVSFGSVAPTGPYWPGLYRAAIDALAELPVRVLMTVGRDRDPAELGPLPANAVVARWIPQADLMGAVSAIVSHGGSGTVRQALAHGIPQVIVPLFADQHHNAELVDEAGAGIALRGEGAQADPAEAAARVHELARAVWQVLDDPRYGAAAVRIAEETAALPPVDAAIDELLVLTG